MTHEYMNGGQPLAADHKNAGQICVTLTFDDGATQNIYAADKDEMLDKVIKSYGSTRERNRELQEKKTPATPAVPVVTAPAKLSPEERLQCIADLSDPEKAGAAIARLTVDATGFDLAAHQRQTDAARRLEELKAYRSEQVRVFLEGNPEYVATTRNGNLLRDRAARLAGNEEPTATNYADAYRELADENLFEAAKVTPVPTPPATSTPEPSAPPASRPAGTGVPPSRLGQGSRPAMQQRETYEDYTALSPSEFERRLRDEPGFAEKVDKALAARQGT